VEIGRPHYWRLLHFAKDERAYVGSESFYFPKKDSLFFLAVRASAAPIVPETALSCLSQPEAAVV
jgi:hypothetical protein